MALLLLAPNAKSFFKKFSSQTVRAFHRCASVHMMPGVDKVTKLAAQITTGKANNITLKNT